MANSGCARAVSQTGGAPDPSGVNSLGLPKAPADTRVVVAMSGGVDSSVVAGLLHEQGYDVVGITLQLYDHGQAVQKKRACCAGQDIQDARNVAARLDIPHYVLDYEDRFRDQVMADFAETYLAGQTPIPCVRCNETVKFRDLLDTAKDLGADCMATGHYIRRIVGARGVELHRAVDPDRDQSYFLFSTTPEQLDYLRFPLGGMSKTETRAAADRLGLAVADKPDSQDICFVPAGKYTRVIDRLRPGRDRPGDIVHVDGTVLGRHEGIVHFTVGQRRGLGLGDLKLGDPHPDDEPLYVIALDAPHERVIVGPKSALAVRRIGLKDVNWLGDEARDDAFAAGRAVLVKVRSTRPPVPARLALSGDGPCVELRDGEEGVAPGQACVFYDPADGGARVLGGGWITGTDRQVA